MNEVRVYLDDDIDRGISHTILLAEPPERAVLVFMGCAVLMGIWSLELGYRYPILIEEPVVEHSFNTTEPEVTTAAPSSP